MPTKDCPEITSASNHRVNPDRSGGETEELAMIGKNSY